MTVSIWGAVVPTLVPPDPSRADRTRIASEPARVSDHG